MGKILVACEYSGIVRRAFRALGHDAWSCDLLPAEDGSNYHYCGDVLDILHEGWDLLIVAHPPCTRLCNSGVRWLSKPPAGRTKAELWRELEDGARLFSTLWNADIAHRAIENPVMHKHAKQRITNYAPPAQTIQPWQFGTSEAGPDNETKRTCLWLHNLPPLVPTGTLDGSTARDRVFRMTPGPDRAKERSRFFPGIAAAMAAQWGPLLAENEVAA